MIFMVDNWSLKNKEEHCEGSWFGYSDHDIDILRQKIIEDIDKKLEKIGFSGELDYYDIIKIINKRFGVE